MKFAQMIAVLALCVALPRSVSPESWPSTSLKDNTSLMRPLRASEAVNIYVAGNGCDANPGTTEAPVQSLEAAQALITNPGSVAYNVILSSAQGCIPLGSPGLSTLIWTKSGSADFPITLSSESPRATITRASTATGAYMLKLRFVQYVQIIGVHFENALCAGILLDTSSHCMISSCIFTGSPIAATGAGIVAIQALDPPDVSADNVVADNLFTNLRTAYPTPFLQGIYLACGAHHNVIYNNSIIDPPAYGIHFWHGDNMDNYVINNILVQNAGNGSGKRGIVIGNGDVCSGHPATVSGNVITYNYVWDSKHTDPVEPVRADDPLRSVNTVCCNAHLSLDYPVDPYWVGYTADAISGRVVSGDFDQDGSYDDIAAFYDYGNSQTRIHVWLNREIDNCLLYDYQESSGWWVATGYTAGQIRGVVSGDFDHDGFRDDIAAFYDYGNNETRIHVWLSNGHQFLYQGSSGWWRGTSYNAGKIRGVVSGVFDLCKGQAYRDDIAAFYDCGNGAAQINLWSSNGSTLSASRWWTSEGYDANLIRGVVSGDFNRDDRFSDITAIVDAGNGTCHMHVWLSSGRSFVYDYSWWGSTGYDANQVRGIVSGAFSGEPHVWDDIAAFYDYGNNQSRIHVWTSTSASFTYQGSSGWWTSTDYDANQIAGRVVPVDLGNTGRVGDIVAFYDYSHVGGALRTHGWELNGSALDYQGSGGVPWLCSGVPSASRSCSEGTHYYPLLTAVVGQGTVTKCPDSATYQIGSSVTLTATPAAGWCLTGWSGDASGNANPLTISIDQCKKVTATFALDPTETIHYYESFEDDFLARRNGPDRVDRALSGLFSRINAKNGECDCRLTIRDRGVNWPGGEGGGFSPENGWAALDFSYGCGNWVTFKFKAPSGLVEEGSTITFNDTRAGYCGDGGHLYKYASNDGVSFTRVGDGSDACGTYTFPLATGGSATYFRLQTGTLGGAYEGIWVDDFDAKIIHTAGPCAVDRTPINFGPTCVSVGETKVDSFLVKNVGTAPLSGNITESCDHCELLSGAGPFTLAAGESLQARVRFRPTILGNLPCTISLGCSECPDVQCIGLGEDATPIGLLVEAQWTGSAVEVTWTPPPDQRAADFEVQRADHAASAAIPLENAAIEQRGSSFVLRDDTVEPGRTYTYTVVMSERGLPTARAEAVVQVPQIAHALLQNQPNPFKALTKIPFALAKESQVRLEILDVQGRLVRTLLDEKLRGGVHSEEWDGRDGRGAQVPNGLYFYRLVVENGPQLVRKALLQR